MTAKKTTPRSKTDKAAPEAAVKATATKKSRLVELLLGEGGASIETLSTTLGWQSHSTRAALTGLRKAGYVIERRAAEGEGEGGGASRYRITKAPA